MIVAEIDIVEISRMSRATMTRFLTRQLLVFTSPVTPEHLQTYQESKTMQTVFLRTTFSTNSNNLTCQPSLSGIILDPLISLSILEAIKAIFFFIEGAM